MTWRRFFGGGKNEPESGSPRPQQTPQLEALLETCLAGWKLPADDSGKPIRARDYLRSLSAEKLFDVDEQLRSYYRAVFAHWPENTLSQVVSELDPSVRQSLLFLAAGHYNGRIRQKALWSIPEFPGYLTLAIALIRCADWVPEVSHAARDAVRRLLDSCSGEDVVAAWPLVLRLRSRERVPQDWLDTYVERWMLRSEALPCLRALLHSDNTVVRRWAIARSLDAGISPGFDLLEVALKDPSPAIGLHALRYAQQHCNAARVRAMAEASLLAPHPVIRREALRALATQDGALPRERLLDTACDRSPGVRILSAFLLRERYGEDVTAHLRSVLDCDGDRPTFGALVSLADQALPQDAPRMRRWLTSANGLIRMHSLRGLLKAQAQLTDEEFARLVTEGGARVMRFLSQSISAADIPFGMEPVTFAVTHPAATSETRGNLRRLLKRLPHWDRLTLLLQLQLGDDVTRDWWHQAVEDWTASSNQYAPMGPSRKAALLELLQARRTDLYDASYVLIESAIARH